MELIKIKGYGLTDIGCNRPKNEDYFDINNYIFVLADGIGGHNAGEIASKLAVKNFMKIINKNKDIINKRQSNEIQVQQIIKDAIVKTNEIVFKKSNQKIEYNGMGTTIVTALYQKPNTIHIANVGDSRAYLLRKGKLELLTQDHSITGNMLREGKITKSEANNHPYRHYLTRSIGTSDNIKIYTIYFNVLPDDIILLCSDGLWDVLSDEQIIFLLQKNHSLEKTCQDLIVKANELKSADNISSIVIRVF
jgi:protein phosphatase